MPAGYIKDTQAAYVSLQPVLEEVYFIYGVYVIVNIFYLREGHSASDRRLCR